MHFRVTFTNDLDAYYKKPMTDVNLSLPVEASSFENAVLTAKALLESYVFWPRIFEIVSVVKMDYPIGEVVWTSKDVNYFIPESGSPEFYGNVEFAENLGLKEPVKKAPEIWCLDTGINILDPDGWRHSMEFPWDEPITREEFLERAYMSTVNRWPMPLYDEED